MKLRKIICLSILLFSMQVFGKTPDAEKAEQLLSLKNFITEACKKDTGFQVILAGELVIRYNKIINLPNDDILLSVKGQYNVDLIADEDTGPQGTIALSKLFPKTGTEIYADYSVTPSKTSNKMSTAFHTYISQPIARNAFGSETRLLDKIIGIENSILRHQVVEAYEDYLASVIALYYQWYSDYENIKAARIALSQSAVLLKNIRARYNNRIARYSDVDRVRLQALEKKESLMTLETGYLATRELVYQAIRYDGSSGELRPEYQKYGDFIAGDFDRAYADFEKKGRTHAVLNLINRKGNNEVKLKAEALFPSANLLLGYYQEKNPTFSRTLKRKVVYGGFQLEFPLFREQQKAARTIARIDEHRTKLSVRDKIIRIRTELKKLYKDVALEKKLIEMYRQKIDLSKRVIRDERLKYSQARATLADLLDVIDKHDEYKFQLILHQVKHSVLLVEWHRMTDQLVTPKEMRKKTRIKLQ